MQSQMQLMQRNFEIESLNYQVLYQVKENVLNNNSFTRDSAVLETYYPNVFTRNQLSKIIEQEYYGATDCWALFDHELLPKFEFLPTFVIHEGKLYTIH